MNEYTLQLISFCKLLWVACFCYLYGLGGIRYKALRRYVGAGWIAMAIFIFQYWQGNQNLWAYTYPVLLCAALHKGYGGDTLAKKVWKRALYGLLIGLSSLPLAIISGLWVLYATSVGFVVVGSVVFGAFNPFKNARDEESNVASVAVTLPMFMV